MTRKQLNLKSNKDVVAALRHIKEFKLSPEQVEQRYTIEVLDDMCDEIGLPFIEGEFKEAKVFRLLVALYPIRFTLLYKDAEKLARIDRAATGKQQIEEAAAAAKGKCWSC